MHVRTFQSVLGNIPLGSLPFRYHRVSRTGGVTCSKLMVWNAISDDGASSGLVARYARGRRSAASKPTILGIESTQIAGAIYGQRYSSNH